MRSKRQPKLSLRNKFCAPIWEAKIIQKINIFYQKKCKILPGKVLTNGSINLAQNLLVKQFPGILGLRNTCLGKMYQLEVIPVDKLYIQLLQPGSMHCVCLSNIEKSKCCNGTHYVCNSLFKPKIMLDIVKQVASYLYHDKSTIYLVTRSVQQKEYGVDCGLFSIAFASTLAFSEDPLTITYDAALLRVNLIKCFDNNLMLEFPVTEQHVIKCMS